MSISWISSMEKWNLSAQRPSTGHNRLTTQGCILRIFTSVSFKISSQRSHAVFAQTSPHLMNCLLRWISPIIGWLQMVVWFALLWGDKVPRFWFLWLGLPSLGNRSGCWIIQQIFSSLWDNYHRSTTSAVSGALNNETWNIRIALSPRLLRIQLLLNRTMVTIETIQPLLVSWSTFFSTPSWKQ